MCGGCAQFSGQQESDARSEDVLAHGRQVRPAARSHTAAKVRVRIIERCQILSTAGEGGLGVSCREEKVIMAAGRRPQRPRESAALIAFGRQMRRLREAKAIKQDTIAHVTKVSSAQVSRIEAGRSAPRELS